MFIGAHVSPAGGPANALARGDDRGAHAIQFFNQSPRAWRPTVYNSEQLAAYAEAIDGSGVQSLLIHAVYLINLASEDPEILAKSLTSLIASLKVGADLGAHAVVLHAGSAKSGEVGPAITRAGAAIAEALAQSEGCSLHLENTAGAGATLGRSFTQLAELIDAAGGDQRLGVCLDSCHLYASGFDIRTAGGLTAVVDDCVAAVGLDRLGSLHLNDSAGGLGSGLDRHANVGDGELGDEGCAAFLSEPRFEGLPCVLETPGPDRSGPTAADLELCRDLRERGLAARR